MPYVGVVSIYATFHNVLYRLYAYTDDVTVLQYNPDFNLIGLWNKTKVIKTILLAFIFRDNGTTQLANPMWFVRCLFQTIILYACAEYVLKKIKLYNNLSQFGEAVFFLMAGWYFIYAVAYCVTDINRQFISMGLQLISRKAIWILALHLLAFKVINWIGTLVYHHPKCMIAGYFTSYSHIGYWWIAYSVAGIVLPLLIAYTFEKMLLFLKQ